MGAKAYKLTEKYLDIIQGGSAIEIGSERTEGSTTYLNKLFRSNGIKFYTIDFDEEQYKNASKICNNAYHMTGEHFLEHIFPSHDEKISFAYLDNFDLVTHDGRDWKRRKDLYKKHGLEMQDFNNSSKISHLNQAIKIEKFSAENCLIIIDDTWINEYNVLMGKGAYAVSFLMEAGFELIVDIFIGNEINGLKYGFAMLYK